MTKKIWQSPTGAVIVLDHSERDLSSIEQSTLFLMQFSDEGRKIVLLEPIESLEKEDICCIQNVFASFSIDLFILIAKEPMELSHCFGCSSFSLQFLHFETTEEALNSLSTQLRLGDTVLLKVSKSVTLESILKIFEQRLYPNQCLIDLDAISENLALIRSKAGSDTRIMPMVKAEAYGLNATIIAKFFAYQGVEILGLSSLQEAIFLRNAGITLPLFVFRIAPLEMKEAVEGEFEIAVSSSQEIASLIKEAKCQNKKVKVHLHVDTGMKRLGCLPSEALTLARQIFRSPHLGFEAIFTHLAYADEPGKDSLTKSQIGLFEKLLNEFDSEGIEIPWRHVANSSGIFRFSFNRFNMARIGLSLYGIPPRSLAKVFSGLKPAVSLYSHVVGINHCVKGERVGYGGRYCARRKAEKIAVIPLGYYDGVHCHNEGKIEVLIDGKRAPLVGSICMDFIMADVTHLPSIKIGDPVCIFGRTKSGSEIPVEEIANKGKTIPYELIACLGPRIPRIFTLDKF